MELDAPIYRVKIKYDDKTGMMRNSFVQEPAVEIHKIAFSKEPIQLKFSSVKSEQKFMSVSMLADVPIPRTTPDGEKYFLIFEKDDIKMIVNKGSMEKIWNDISFQHNDKKIIDGVYMVEQFFIEKGRVECPVFATATEGSFVQTYWVKDAKQYAELEANPEFNGFSIELAAQFEEAFCKEMFKQNPDFKEILEGIDVLFDSISDVKERKKAITNYLEIKNKI